MPKIRSKKRWIIAVLLVFIGCFVIESVHAVLVGRRVLREVTALSAFKSHFMAEVEQTCPKDRFQTRYLCFRSAVRPYLTQPLDSAQSIMLLSVGVIISMKDKTTQRCKERECAANLLEFTQDVAERLLRSPTPSRYSPFILDQVELLGRAKFYSTLERKLNEAFRNDERTRIPASDGVLTGRLDQLKKRFDRMRPQLEEQSQPTLLSRIIEHFVK